MEELYDKARRSFLKHSLPAMAVATLLPGKMLLARDPREISLTILHTNDVHSQIDPFELSHPKYPGMGGAAIRSAVIRQIRAREERVLLFDAGDIFQGTPYYNMYGGEPEIRLMSYMKYDGATIGNHDFDKGIEGLEKQLKHATFPIISSNYDFTGTIMEGKSVPYKIFIKGGVKVGVFGLGIELKGLVDSKLYGNTKYQDPLTVAGIVSNKLKYEKKCGLVICLSHLGLQYNTSRISDLVLAKSDHCIDLIIGGHTHSFLDEPIRERSKEGREVLITQAGYAGLRLGSVDFIFDKNSGQKIKTDHAMIEMRKSSEN